MKLFTLFLCSLALTASAQWSTVGPSKFSSESVRDTSIDTNDNGVYVGFIMNGKPSVYAAVNDDWVSVGLPELTSYNVNSMDMALGNEAPFVVFNKVSTPRRPSVMTFNGSDWEYVGNEDFFATSTQFLSLEVVEDVPYVAFQNTTTGKANVMKYDGSAWVYVGNSEIGTGTVWNPDFEFIDETPYLSFREFLGPGVNKLQVMRLVGNTWEYAGNTVVNLASNSDGTNPLVNSSLTSDPITKTAYISYIVSDPANVPGNVLVTRKLVGNDWQPVGDAVPNVRNTIEGSKALFFAGRPTVAYNGVDPLSSNVKVAVTSFNGTTWEPVGGTLFASAGMIDAENFPEDRDYDLGLSDDFLYLSYAEDDPVDGRATVRRIANPLGLDEPDNPISLLPYPNPSTGLFYLGNRTAIQQWSVYNLLGQRLQSGTTNVLDLSNQPDGMYLLTVEFGNSVGRTVKLVKGN